MGLVLSEEAKVAYLQEKIKETKRKQWSGDFVIGCGLSMSGIGLVLALVRPDLLDILYRILFIIVGAIFVAGGTIQYNNARKQYYSLMGQLKQMSSNIICPKCEKQIPQGNFIFCPFCGEQLQRK
jgi:hypothetical protein